MCQPRYFSYTLPLEQVLYYIFSLHSFFQKKSDNEISPEIRLEDLGFEGSGTKIWVGKDYTNFIFKDFVDLDKPFTGLTSFGNSS